VEEDARPAAVALLAAAFSDESLVEEGGDDIRHARAAEARPAGEAGAALRPVEEERAKDGGTVLPAQVADGRAG
jgi:hypothetical protein